MAVRARDAGSTRVTELVLDRSSYRGASVRLGTDRRYLARAARLGCREIAIAGADAPLACRDARLTYAWMPLDPEDALEHPERDAIRLEMSGSKSSVDHAVVRPVSSLVTNPATPRNPMRESISQAARAPIATVPQAARVDPVQPAANLAALIAEAEQLHAALGAAKLGLARLIAVLRRHRK